MSRRDRFERLESERTTPGGPHPSPGVEGRFGPAPTVPASEVATARSGGTPERFEEAVHSEALRPLDLSEGQPFVRCARCRADHHVTAVLCSSCGADLCTAEQRAFNEALWNRRLEEKAEEERELERLREAREQADRELRDALRQRREFEQQWERRRSRGLEGDGEDNAVDTLQRLGHAIGGWLRRHVRHRGLRLAIIAGGTALVVLLAAQLYTVIRRGSAASLTFLVIVAIVLHVLQWRRR